MCYFAGILIIVVAEGSMSDQSSRRISAPRSPAKPDRAMHARSEGEQCLSKSLISAAL